MIFGKICDLHENYCYNKLFSNRVPYIENEHDSMTEQKGNFTTKTIKVWNASSFLRNTLNSVRYLFFQSDLKHLRRLSDGLCNSEGSSYFCNSMINL